MSSQTITDLTNLPHGDIQPDDLMIIVDVSAPSSPTGETKNITFEDLTQTVIDQITSSLTVVGPDSSSLNHVTHIIFEGTIFSASFSTSSFTTSSFATITANSSSLYVTNYASSGSTTSSIHPVSEIIFKGTNFSASYPDPSTIDIESNKLVVYESGSLVSQAASSINFIGHENAISSSVSGSDVSMFIKPSFLNLTDVIPTTYDTNSLVVTNTLGTGLIFLPLPSSTGTTVNIFGGASARGTYYFNGNIKERMYANTNVLPIYSGSISEYYEDFIHSGNIYLDTVSSSIYFCRGSWPRRMGTSSIDKNGFTWRETTTVGETSSAEAICRTRDDGQNFEVLLDLYAQDINGSGANSVKNGSTFVVSEPTAVVYDYATDKVFFACKNDHDKSIVYRMNASGTQTSRATSCEVWTEMFSSDLKIESLDIATTPANFYSASLPSTNTRYLYIGVGPDYISSTNTASSKHAAIFRVPTTGSAIGSFLVDYPVAYTIHEFWGSSYDSTSPRMDRTGIKGIKVVFESTGSGAEWNPITEGSDAVKKENSRIYVVSSGAKSLSSVVGIDSKSSQIVSFTTQSLASSFAIDTQLYFATQSIGVGPGGTSVGSTNFSLSPSQALTSFSHVELVGTASDGYLQVPSLQHGDNYPTPLLPTPATPGGRPITAPLNPITSSIVLTSSDNEQFGGHALLELLVGDVSGVATNINFNGTYDYIRPYKTWRRGQLLVDGVYSKLELGTDDPALPTGSIGVSGIGTARGVALSVDDRLFILTSPEYTTAYDGQVPSGSLGGRGVAKLTTSGYRLEGTDGTTGINTYVMVIPVLANTIDQEDTSMITRSPSGFQQVAIDIINEKFYMADFNHCTVYGSTLLTSASFAGYRRFAGIAAGSYENENGDAYVNWTATSATTAPYTMGNVLAAGYPNAGQRYFPSNWDYAWPVAYTSLSTTALGSHPSIPADTVGSDAHYDSTVLSSFSKFGTIFEGDLFTYSRSDNGKRLFDEDTEIAYSRPCGLVGYNMGPESAFRLIYTNGENNFTLLSNTLGDGIYINGLSRTFVKDNVLAEGSNILSVTDAGTGLTGGIVVSFISPASTSDYVIQCQGSQGEVFGTGQYHNGNPALSGSGNIDLTIAQSNSSLYYAKNKSKFRLTYSGSLPQVLHFSCF